MLRILITHTHTHTNNYDNSNNNKVAGRKVWEVIDMSTALIVKVSWYTYPQTHAIIYINYVPLLTWQSELR